MQVVKRIGAALLGAAGVVGLAANAAGQCETQRLAPTLDPLDAFGWSTSISGDWLMVGAIGDDDFFQNSGAVYIYQRTGGVWAQTQKVFASDPLFDAEFGNHMAIDGTTAVLTAHKNDDGKVYVFQESGGTWSEVQKLAAPGGVTQHHFGHSVALSGTTILVGRMRDDHAGFESGSAHIFDNSGSGWVHVTKLTASTPGVSDRFGRSVTIQGDYAVVAAHKHNADAGAVFVYERNDNGTPADPTDDLWPEVAKLTANDQAAGDHFGRSVSVDGDTLLVGAAEDFIGGVQTGSAYVFERIGGVWQQTQKLMANDGQDADGFGEVVHLNGDTALIGAAKDDDVGSNAGAMYLFKRNAAGTWLPAHTKVFHSDPTGDDQLGDEVSIVMSGNTVVASAWGNSTAVNLGGAAYVFDLPFSYCTGKTNTQGCVPVINYIRPRGRQRLRHQPVLHHLRASCSTRRTASSSTAPTARPASPSRAAQLCVGAPVTRTGVQFSGGKPAARRLLGQLRHRLQRLHAERRRPVAGGRDGGSTASTGTATPRTSSAAAASPTASS